MTSVQKGEGVKKCSKFADNQECVAKKRLFRNVPTARYVYGGRYILYNKQQRVHI